MVWPTKMVVVVLLVAVRTGWSAQRGYYLDIARGEEALLELPLPLPLPLLASKKAAKK